MSKLSPNQAAARAIQLYTQEAELCDVHPSKIARTHIDGQEVDGGSSTVVGSEGNQHEAAKDCGMIHECDMADSNGDTRWEFLLIDGGILGFGNLVFRS